MFGALGGAWAPEQGGADRSGSWQDVHDDAGRVESLAYGHDLLRLDECGPAGGTDGGVR